MNMIKGKTKMVDDKALNVGIVNQYGQLLGDYSKLDDDLWLGADDNSHTVGGDGSIDEDEVQCQIVPFQENLVDLAQKSANVNNSISSGALIAVNENSSLKHIFQNQSQISSPVSVLQNRRSYSDDKSQHHQLIEHNSPVPLQSIPAREQSQGLDSDQSEYSEESIPAKHQVRTRKISDILDLNLEPPKKCLHCETSETPQWRAGPMGPKTLCNACGVQYKHGRLFHDYRPLKSPTFNPSIHSNLPKKVQEMRMGKTSDAFPNPTKKLKKSTPTTDPSLNSNLGDNVQEVKVRYTSERHPHLPPNPNNVEERAPIVSTSLLSILDKKVEEMIMGSTSAMNPNKTSETKIVEEMKLVRHNDEVQNRAERAKKFQEMREKVDDFPLPDYRERNEKSEAKKMLKQKKSLKEMKKCLHCESTKTPQWREGPMGRNTLCNACGVQYRHGRLFPEYCPLKSPKYDPSVHSHLPKKVFEMRKRLAEKSANSEEQA